MPGLVAEHVEKKKADLKAAENRPLLIQEMEKGVYDRLEPSMSEIHALLQSLKEGAGKKVNNNGNPRWIEEMLQNLDSARADLRLRLDIVDYDPHTGAGRTNLPSERVEAYEEPRNSRGNYAAKLKSTLSNINSIIKEGANNTFDDADIANLKLLKAKLEPVQGFLTKELEKHNFTPEDYAALALKIRLEAEAKESAKLENPTPEKLKAFTQQHGARVAQLAKFVRQVVAHADKLENFPDSPTYTEHNRAFFRALADKIDAYNGAIASLGEGVPLTNEQVNLLHQYHHTVRVYPEGYEGRSSQLATVSSLTDKRPENALPGDYDMWEGARMAIEWAKSSETTDPQARLFIAELKRNLPIVRDVREALAENNINPAGLETAMLDNQYAGPQAQAPVVTKPEESRIITPGGEKDVGSRLILTPDQLSAVERARYLPASMDAGRTATDWTNRNAPGIKPPGGSRGR